MLSTLDRSHAQPHQLPHHDGSPLYVSDLSPAPGDRVRVRVRVPESFGVVASVHVRSTPDQEPRFGAATLLGAQGGWQWWEAGVAVDNPVTGYRFLITLDDGSHWWLNAAGVHDIETLDSADFKLVSHPAAPDWASSSVIYQIFPDRFGRSPAADLRQAPAWGLPAAWEDEVEQLPPGRSHQFYGGDLDGVIAHLDHLERLGVTLLYLTPVFPGGSNHRYDASSFHEVDPLLGGDEALVRLVGAAHERGFKIIGDLTSNHSGNRHEWFRAAHRTPGAAESAFYYWLDEQQDDYEAWLGVPALPKFNWNSVELRTRFIEGPDSVVGKWLRKPYNLDGWRIDVANMTGRLGGEDLNAEVRQTIRRTMIEANPDTILLAESTNDASGDFQGDAWHGAMTYTTFTRPVWSWLSKPDSPSPYFGLPYGTIPQSDGRQFVEAHTRFTAGYPWRTRLSTMNALDTHDTPRFRTHAIDGGVPVAFGLSATLPGLPVVFAGDEFGLVGEDGEHSRTPMPWDTAAEPDVAATIDLYAELIRLRTGHPALNGGGMRWLHVGADVLVYVREAEEESVLLMAARSACEVTLPEGAVAGAATRLLGAAELTEETGGIRLTADGPSFTAWALPGARAPKR
ncbi:glycoside hydrolase family 13 protein [Cryobacterium sp. TMT1-21]|uniref:Glycoside hydrolase family 13 protein n=1 Tax=Cryobacterium shii TaxID=1259235 RepID=A0AAQ2C6K9_9MICO|nr:MULTISPECIES: glycoside hydrolase family 13 protein [Cryobacterium]TFC48628.1 glycoside hydrolase family 13 protein [Cryobacterium shii]TFC86623.1 glycoside hydrolase family 13 protein [Cryobacterium sp. TmT2-59]TFD07876.1 glycoside hydrolase family 13 protein [Cryobacterium sp. TMT1-21]TFD15605.1 glycoside hydrolase family 13 protein [Cryobacterium sp. TMT4-10]TFD26950.1 glycoside hydrolase family 13 protein [Cryobacterium sp. TMT2-23]